MKEYHNFYSFIVATITLTMFCAPINGYLELTSPAFKHNQPIPEKYTCYGDNISPELRWKGVPEGTKSFTLIVEDPDAPEKKLVHWLLFDILPTVHYLPENALTGQFTAGITDFGSLQYTGPCPSKGTHRYVFTLYACTINTEEFRRATPDLLRAGSTKKQVLNVMHNNILESATLIGTCTQKK